MKRALTLQAGTVALILPNVIISKLVEAPVKSTTVNKGHRLPLQLLK